jgi:SNF2 family DNA or RNA helicase
MTKAVVLPFLPPVLEERRDIPMTPKQQKAYDDLVAKMVTMLDDGDMLAVTNTLTMSLRLLQLASSYGEIEVAEKITEDGTIEFVDKLRLTAPSSKIDAFMEDLDDYAGRSVVVFAVSRQLIMMLSEQLTKKEIPHGLIVGDQHMLDRQLAIDEFQAGKTKLILVTLAAGGTGITLTAADTAVYLQRSWSLIDMAQASGRYHRIGSERHESITRIDYVTPNTIEEAVIAALEGKSAGLEDLVRDRELLIKAMRGAS